LATSACNRARFRGSAGVVVSLPVFFIRGPAKLKKPSFTQALVRFYPGNLSTEFVHKYVDRSPRNGANAMPRQRLALHCSRFRHRCARDTGAIHLPGQSAPALNIVAVTRLRPECLLR
jgi:hypothetical protein